MAKWKEGDKVKVVTRAVTAEDRRSNLYFEHMAGLQGVVTNVYSPEEVVVEVDQSTVPKVSKDVHVESVRRLRLKTMEALSEEAKAKFEPHELNFDGHFVILARGEDLEKV